MIRYIKGYLDWKTPGTFTYNGETLNYFHHNHNCGFPPFKCTERIIELSIANYWLNNTDSIVYEIGCVSPYYWPKRDPHIVDPFDTHPLNYRKLDMFDVDLEEKNVLSISTIEHIGLKDYNQSCKFNACDAFTKIINESSKCLITFPLGYNKVLDRFFCENYDNSIDPSYVTYYTRYKQNIFRSEKFVKKDYHFVNIWADNLIVYEK